MEAYKQEMDIFGQWFEECCELGQDLEETAMLAYASFKNWAGFSGFKCWTGTRFGRKVKERFSARRTAAQTVYGGFKVRTDFAFHQARL